MKFKNYIIYYKSAGNWKSSSVGVSVVLEQPLRKVGSSSHSLSSRGVYRCETYVVRDENRESFFILRAVRAGVPVQGTIAIIVRFESTSNCHRSLAYIDVIRWRETVASIRFVKLGLSSASRLTASWSHILWADIFVLANLGCPGCVCMRNGESWGYHISYASLSFSGTRVPFPRFFNVFPYKWDDTEGSITLTVTTRRDFVLVPSALRPTFIINTYYTIALEYHSRSPRYRLYSRRRCPPWHSVACLPAGVAFSRDSCYDFFASLPAPNVRVPSRPTLRDSRDCNNC